MAKKKKKNTKRTLAKSDYPCTKRKYSRVGALYSLANAQDRNNEYRPIRSYECIYCGCWHLTSEKQRKSV